MQRGVEQAPAAETWENSLRFNRLTVLRYAGSNVHKKRLVLAQCTCGKEVIVVLSHLKNGNTKSCGCWNNEVRAEHGRANGTHRETGRTAEYVAWKSMKQRCSYLKHKSYKDYGGRGISVCERWQNSYENFLNDLGRKPGPEYSIDRINNDGNYEPQNCRWTAAKVQRANQR